MIYIWIVIVFLFWLFTYYVTKDLLSPVSISGIIWMLEYLLLSFTQSSETLSNWYYGLFALAYVFFSIGFLCTNPKRRLVQDYSLNYKVSFNPDFRRIMTIVIYACAFGWLLSCYSYFVDNHAGLWSAARTALDETESLQSNLSGVLQNVVAVYFIVAYTFYLLNKTKQNKRNLILAIPPLFMVMLLSSRGTWYLLIISIVMITFLVGNYSNRKVLFIGLLGLIGFLLIFVLSSLQKYAAATSSYDLEEKITLFFKMYFTTPPVAFVNWINSTPKYYHGAYVFRFFYAIAHALGIDCKVVNTIQPFVEVDGVWTNVYTAIHWYASDFGIISIIIVEFILGFAFGKIWQSLRRKKEPSVFSIVIFSMLMFTIVIQFFSEQFFAILSLWIQRVILLYLFTKTKLCKHEVSS